VAKISTCMRGRGGWIFATNPSPGWALIASSRRTLTVTASKQRCRGDLGHLDGDGAILHCAGDNKPHPEAVAGILIHGRPA
jgi:hypothetical protein